LESGRLYFVVPDFKIPENPSTNQDRCYIYGQMYYGGKYRRTNHHYPSQYGVK